MNKPLRTVRLAITNEQLEELRPLFEKLKYGCAVIAQVYPDGMVATFLNEEEALNVNDALLKTRVKNNSDKKYASSLNERFGLNETSY